MFIVTSYLIFSSSESSSQSRQPDDAPGVMLKLHMVTGHGRSDRIYLDYASTSPPRDVAVNAVADLLGEKQFGDPSRNYYEAMLIREHIERARESVADLIGAKARNVVFTSSGTEAINLAIYNAARYVDTHTLPNSNGGRSVILCTELDHSSIRLGAELWGVPYHVPVNPETAQPDIGILREMLADYKRNKVAVALVNCQVINHESGTFQPFREIIDICREFETPVHVDACNAIGYELLEEKLQDVDYVSMTAHKLGAFSGIGALIVKGNIRIKPIIVGAAQERMRRAGMENYLGIHAFGTVCRQMSEDSFIASELTRYRELLKPLRLFVEQSPYMELLPFDDNMASNYLLISLNNVKAEAVLIGLDKEGISVHSGSSCSSEPFSPPSGFSALGIDVDSILRISVGWATREKDIKVFTSKLEEITSNMSAFLN